MVLLRDEQYFDGKLFAFSNKEIIKIAKVYAKDKQMPLYIVVDKALRDLLKQQGFELPEEPKKPQLI